MLGYYYDMKPIILPDPKFTFFFFFFLTFTVSNSPHCEIIEWKSCNTHKKKSANIITSNFSNFFPSHFTQYRKTAKSSSKITGELDNNATNRTKSRLC